MQFSCTPSSLVAITVLLVVAMLTSVLATLIVQGLRAERRRTKQFAALMETAPRFNKQQAANLLGCRIKTARALIGHELEAGTLIRNDDDTFSLRTKPSATA
jgi:K+-sensing histidine kinase KdpD